MTAFPLRRERPGVAVFVGDPLVLGARPDETLRFVSMLRDRLSAGVIVRWRGAVAAPLSTPTLWHLPPPDGSDDESDVWRARFRVGLCYFRRGPGFILVKDTRDPGASARFVIDDPVLISVMTRCLDPTPLAGMTCAERDAADELLAERLLLRAGDHVVTLPYRLRRWPVPATAV